MGRLVLITGGARSGKSSLALTLAESSAGPRFFVATCPCIDQEMEERIRRHQQERAGRGWQVLEEEVALAQTVRACEPGAVVLVDCLTLWINNLMYLFEKSDKSFSDNDLDGHCQELLQAIADRPGTAICVTNEVGMGIVPEYPAARLYRDLVGRCNRLLAAAADEVIMVSCGLPLYLKGHSGLEIE